MTIKMMHQMDEAAKRDLIQVSIIFIVTTVVAFGLVLFA